jgi:hypothetical protein
MEDSFEKLEKEFEIYQSATATTKNQERTKFSKDIQNSKSVK